MEIDSHPLPSALVLRPEIFRDERGLFIKPYSCEEFRAIGLDFQPREEFYSISRKGVLRGMHFQLPPREHDKVVHCVRGSALDVILDLRRGSPTFGKSAAINLSAGNHLLIWIPKGFAHGFLSLEEETLMVYLTGSSYSAMHDSGVRWDSFGFDWPEADPVISARDSRLEAFSEWTSPFE